VVEVRLAGGWAWIEAVPAVGARRCPGERDQEQQGERAADRDPGASEPEERAHPEQRGDRPRARPGDVTDEPAPVPRQPGRRAERGEPEQGGRSEARRARQRPFEARRCEERQRGRDRDQITALPPTVGEADPDEGEEEEGHRDRREQEPEPPRRPRQRQRGARRLQRDQHRRLPAPQRLEEEAPGELPQLQPRRHEPAVGVVVDEPECVTERRCAGGEVGREGQRRRARGRELPVAGEERDRPDRRVERPLGPGDGEPAEASRDDPWPPLGPAQRRDGERGGEG
jgi:hypothetical protein